MGSGLGHSLRLRKTAFPPQALAGFPEPPRAKDPGPLKTSPFTPHPSLTLCQTSEKLLAPHGLLFPHLPFIIPLRGICWSWHPVDTYVSLDFLVYSAGIGSSSFYHRCSSHSMNFQLSPIVTIPKSGLYRDVSSKLQTSTDFSVSSGISCKADILWDILQVPQEPRWALKIYSLVSALTLLPISSLSEGRWNFLTETCLFHFLSLSNLSTCLHPHPIQGHHHCSSSAKT